MEFKLTKEQELIQKAAREFAEKRIEPIAIQIDRDNEVPAEIFQEMGELGFFGTPFPEEYGGSGAGYLSYALAVEQIARISGGVAMTLSVSVLGLSAINLFGTPEQKAAVAAACLRRQADSLLRLHRAVHGVGPENDHHEGPARR